VDPLARRLFWRLIRQMARDGTTIFVTTHYLDEAEYCARIGLMVAGRLVALDTPAALKQRYVPGRILLARGRNLLAAGASLRGRPGVLAVEPFGAGLHLQVTTDWNADRVASVLGNAGAQAVVLESGEPTLEDVFLAVVARPAQATP
jgi:ABC-2 type transport system ATP-binding protein